MERTWSKDFDSMDTNTENHEKEEFPLLELLWTARERKDDHQMLDLIRSLKDPYPTISNQGFGRSPSKDFDSIHSDSSRQQSEDFMHLHLLWTAKETKDDLRALDLLHSLKESDPFKSLRDKREVDALQHDDASFHVDLEIAEKTKKLIFEISAKQNESALLNMSYLEM